MKVTIQYSAQARLAAGVSSECIELDGPISVQDVLRLLARRHGESLARIILDTQGNPHPALLLFVCDEQVLPGAGRELQPGDVLSILPPVAGG